MKRLSKLVLLLVWVVSIQSDPEICKENGGIPQIAEAFRMGSNVGFMTSDGNFYTTTFTYDGQLGDFSIDANSLTKQVANNWDLLKNMKLFFSIKYPNETGDIRLIGVRLENRDGTNEQFIGYVIEFDPNFTPMGPLKEFNLNIYKYVPNEDPLNLMTLFTKFPQIDIHNRMVAILSFPLNGAIVALPKRFFVYYMEMPNNTPGGGNSPYEFKRHIIMGQNANYGNQVELEWAHDLNSNKCIDQNIVSAAFSLTDDYTSAQNQYTFDLIEFTNTSYAVKRVHLTTHNVSEVLDQLKSDSISKLFGCTVITTTPFITGTAESSLTPGITESTDDSFTTGGPLPSDWTPGSEPPPSKPSEKKETHLLWIAMICIFVFIVIAIIGSMLYFHTYSGNIPVTQAGSSRAQPHPESGVQLQEYRSLDTPATPAIPAPLRTQSGPKPESGGQSGPTAGTSEPKTGTTGQSGPPAGTSKSTDGTEDQSPPKADTSEPKVETEEQSEPTPQSSEPTAQTSEPTAQTSEPTAQTSEPTVQTSEPTVQTSEPTAQTSGPTAQTSEPTTQSSEPKTQTSEPTAGTEGQSKTTAESSEPKTETNKGNEKSGQSDGSKKSGESGEPENEMTHL